MPADSRHSARPADDTRKAADIAEDTLNQVEAAMLLERLERAASFRRRGGQRLTAGALPFISGVLSQN